MVAAGAGESDRRARQCDHETGEADRGAGLEALAEDGNAATLGSSLAAVSGLANEIWWLQPPFGRVSKLVREREGFKVLFKSSHGDFERESCFGDKPA